jgi:sigma-B regulation protein RsbU (phosphoserine phosphatase)
MKSKVTAGLYVLLIVFAAFSMGYYIAGALALREEFFHASRYARAPFDFHDDGQTLDGVRKEATVAGLSNGDFLLAVNGVPFTGYAQIHDLLQHTNPGQIIEVSARTPSGKVREVQIRLASRKSPNYSIGGYIAFLTPILGVPLLGLLIGYWVVAARPRDLNAWLVFLLLAFPETAFGNLDWKFWPSPWYLVLFVWNSLVQAFVFPALVWFGFLFPERWRVDLRLPWLKYAVLAAFFCIFIFESGLISGQFFSVDVIRSLAPLQLWVDRADSWLQVICILLFLAALFDLHGRCTAPPAGTGHRKCLVAWPPGHHLHRSAVVWHGPALWEMVLHCRPIYFDLSPYPRLCSDRAAGHGCSHSASHGHEISARSGHSTDC